MIKLLPSPLSHFSGHAPFAAWLRCATACLALGGASLLHAAPAPVDCVNPLSGTNGNDGFSRGNTYPAICLPFSPTTWSPTTNNASSWFYTMDGKQFEGIRATHQPSVWIRDYGDFSFLPVVGSGADPSKSTAPRDLASPFSHDHEKALPYYYSVQLDRYQTQLEMAPAERSCLVKISFPAAGQRSLVFYNPRGEFSLDRDRRYIAGTARHVTFGAPGNFAMYFVAEFDHPFASEHVLPGDPKEKGSIGAALHFADGPDNQTVQMRVGTSFISYDQARLNLQREVPDWSLDAAKARARDAWAKQLATVDIEGGTDAQRTTFYTALYRALQFPRAFHETNAEGKKVHYSPFNDGKVMDGPLYTDDGLWDTYRAAFPLLALYYPERSSDTMQGWLNAYREGGWLPTWPSPGNRPCMIGSHGQSIVADAYFKGVPGFDLNDAYAAVRKDSVQDATGAWAGRDHLNDYIQYGYVPADKRKDGSAAVTLEYAYDDYCAAKLAKALGHADDAKLFAERARNYQHVWDPETGFMRGKKSDGTWTTPFDPIEWGNAYVEGNAWQWLWSVMQDPYGLMKLLGGREATAQKLDTLLGMSTDYKPGSYGGTIHEMRETVAAKMGQYAHVNEPDHHVLYFYNYAGQPWKTQAAVRRVMDELYGPDGMVGDEDTGQMSAWYVFNAAGFYPFCPGNPVYLLGSPLFPRTTIHLAGGKTFTVQAVNNGPANRYIQSARLNGEPFNKTYLTHTAIVQGGTLELTMGAEPNKQWGTAPDAAPPDDMP